MERAKLVIVEPFATGHHISLYLRSLLLKMVVNNHFDVVLITTSNVLKSAVYSNLCKEIRPFVFEVIEINIDLYSKSQILRFVKSFNFRCSVHHEVVSRFPNAIVYWNTLDFVSKTFWLIPKFNQRSKYYGLQMKEGNLSRLLSSGVGNIPILKLYAFFVKRMGFENIAMIDVRLFSQVERLVTGRITYIGDPTNFTPKKDTDIVEPIIAGKEVVNILVFGSITRRKGIHDLKDLLTGFKYDCRFKITIAGSVSKSFLADLNVLVQGLRYNDIQVKVINQWVSNDEERHLFDQADLIWVAYDKKFTGSSGVLFSACAMGKPVIARNSGYISYLVEKYSIGIVCNFDDLANSQNTLYQILKSNSSYNRACKNAIDIGRLHTSENFAVSVLNMLGIDN